MKIKTQKIKTSNKKILTIVVGALLLVVGALLLYVYVFHGTPFNQSGNTSPTNTPQSKNSLIDDQKGAGDSIKQTSIDSTQPSSPSSTPENGKANVGVSITTANQAGNIFQIRAQISTITDTGTCTLTLTKGSVVVSKTAGVQALASTSTCQGFNIDTSELSSGNWQLLLQFENSTLTGSSSQTITVT